jgi:hypothetical protein
MSKLSCSSDSDRGFEDSANFEEPYYTNLRVVYSALGCTSIIPSEDVLFIPQEYARLEKTIEISLREWDCLLVTGERGLGAFYAFPSSKPCLKHPCISGKTTFLIYLLLRRLEQRLPTAIQLDASRFFIFDQFGASMHRPSDLPARLWDCIALVDSNDDVTRPCLAIRRQARFIVCATSPDPEQYWSWTRHLFSWPVAINPSMKLEIASLAYVHGSHGLCVRPLI